MSESILKALMQLFALVSFPTNDSISRRLIVHSFLEQQLSNKQILEYIKLFDQKAEEIESKMNEKDIDPKKRLSSNSVRVLKIASQINEELTSYQKIIVLIQLIEFIKSGNQIVNVELEFLTSIAQSFNIATEDYQLLTSFIINDIYQLPESKSILSITKTDSLQDGSIKTALFWENLNCEIRILSLSNYDVFLLRVSGESDIIINGQSINPSRIHILKPGSSIRNKGIKPIYFNDIVSNFSNDITSIPIHFDVKGISYKFNETTFGLQPLSFKTGSGQLVGIMGSSGSGKSTLVNVLSGNLTPYDGSVLLNGTNVHFEPEEMKGLIGVVSQDDLLIEDLTVFQNLYFNARLCFDGLSDLEIIDKVETTLKSLGLFGIKEMKVGDPLNKKISGGQRKRLNIALELIREPAVLFLDEPTSGLSSRDSENIMDLLKELTLKGKLIFVVIHQPSSDIFKMFSQLLMLDEGGRLIYDGDPVESLRYFKNCTHHANSEENECPICGNVNSEQLLNIVYSKVLDEYGNNTETRKTSSEEWYHYFVKSQQAESTFNNGNVKRQLPTISFKTPSKIEQFKIFTLRDILAKYANKQYLIINLFEVPALAILLASIIRFYDVDALGNNGYTFSGNPNVTVYIIMAVIISLFVGLSVSAEEVINDRKILNREKFLNLSWLSYLFSKSAILIGISAIQSLLFVLIGNTIISLKGMYFSYWLILFSSSVFANILGLNISASFKKAVNIYILIPFLIIPQLILSGVFLSFDRLNPSLSTPSGIPWYGEFITARWAFEAIAVNQYINNEYEQEFYVYKKARSQAKFQIDYKIPALKNKVDYCLKQYNPKKEANERLENGCELLLNEIEKNSIWSKSVNENTISKLERNIFDKNVANSLNESLNKLRNHYLNSFSKNDKQIEKIIAKHESSAKSKKEFLERKKEYYNEDLERLVRNTNNFFSNKIIEYDGELIQKTDLVYSDPTGQFFGAHFLAPIKKVFGFSFPTYWYNLIVIWILNIFLFISLYYKWLDYILNIGQKIRSKVIKQ